MRLRTLLRVNPGAWLSLPMVLLAILYVRTYQARVIVDPYPVGVTATATATLGFIVPICAALGAWEGGRLRRAGWWDGPHVRSRLVVAAWALAPVVVAGAAAVGAGVLVNLAGAGLIVPDLRPLLVDLLVIIAHSLAGFALGASVPLTIAAPSALLGSFVWMVFLRALEPLWLRFLNGAGLELCCATWADLAPAAVLGPALVAVGLGLAAAVLLSRARWSWLTALTSAVPLVVALTVGAALVSDLGSYPTVARDASLLECTQASSNPRVCVWPEHRERLAEVATIATDAAGAWRAVGLAVPAVFAEGEPGRSSADRLDFAFTLGSRPDNIIDALAYAMLPPWPACADRGPFPGADATPYLVAWLESAAGMSAEEVAMRFPDVSPLDPSLFPDALPLVLPSVRDTVGVIRALPADAQRTWVQRNLAALLTCEIEPALAPPS